uniref:Vesicle transport protein n=1 Tax=Paramormyrops kingsleyae TaxID=1676925 RepID=A0A3B3T6P5_9TELE
MQRVLAGAFGGGQQRADVIKGFRPSPIVNLVTCDFLMPGTEPFSPMLTAPSVPVVPYSGCKLYTFCGAVFGFTSMTNLLATSQGRCLVITRSLQALQWTPQLCTALIIFLVCLYSLACSLAPLLGWSVYTPTYANKSYSLMLCCSMFFILLALKLGWSWMLHNLLLSLFPQETAGVGIQVRKSSLTQEKSIRNEAFGECWISWVSWDAGVSGSVWLPG